MDLFEGKVYSWKVEQGWDPKAPLRETKGRHSDADLPPRVAVTDAWAVSVSWHSCRGWINQS